MPCQPYALYPNESDLEVSRQRCLLWKFFCSQFTMLAPFQQGKFHFLCLSCFRNIQPVKTILAPDDEYCFLLLLLQAIVIIMGIALINVKAKSIMVFVIILLSWGIVGDSWLMTWFALSCNSQSYDNLRSALYQTPWVRPSQFVEAWKSSVEGVICESRLQQIAHTVKFTKLANMITLKRSLIAQSQKLVPAYTRPQVRIVSFNFSDNYNIKRNTTMNVNRSQRHGLVLHYITQAKSGTTKLTVMHHTLTHFNL